MMKKNNENYYIIEILLSPEIWQKDIIDKRLECSRKVYNALLSKELKKYNELVRTRKYRELISSLSGNKKSDKHIWESINELTEEYKITNFDFIKDVKPMYKHFKKCLSAQICQQIADRVWSSIDSILHKPSRKVHFKKFGEYTTIQGKQASTGIRFLNDFIDFMGMKIKICYPKNKNDFSYYENFLFPALDRIKYCSIIRKEIRGKYKYYVQITIKGNDVSKRYKLGNGRVGIDIGTSTIAISSDSVVDILELAKQSQEYERQKICIQRKMDRSRRITNLNKYNEKGTIKKGNKDKWLESNNYRKLKAQYKELCRQQKVYRTLEHNSLTNYIITLGDNFYVETMNFSALAKRSRGPTEYKKNGKCKKKKRFGKSICNRAPALIITILDRKLKHLGTQLNKINTQKCKASQYDHTTDDFNKKDLSDRWHLFSDGKKVQRDLYSAFLISNVSESLDYIDRDVCITKFDTFFELHNKKILELQNIKDNQKYKFLSCIGI